MFMKVAISGISMVAAAALTLGAASIASAQQSNPSGTLMQERQGAMGVEKGAQKPATQGNLTGKDAPSADDEAKAATGQGTQGGGLDFGAKGSANEDKSLPAQRQGTIGNPERPPEPTTQGGGTNKQ
jgi:hypothetical protein